MEIQFGSIGLENGRRLGDHAGIATLVFRGEDPAHAGLEAEAEVITRVL
jgi:hypothetical protein